MVYMEAMKKAGYCSATVHATFDLAADGSSAPRSGSGVARQPGKHALHPIDAPKIDVHVMIAASLSRGQAEATLSVGLAGPGTTQVNHRSEVLPVLQRRPGNSLTLERCRDAAIEKRRGERHSVAGHDAAIETAEPAQADYAHEIVFGDARLIQAFALRLGERRIGNLVHADRAGSRSIQFERMPGQMPLPVRLRKGIASALDLGKCGQEFRGNHDGGVFAEVWLILSPRLRRRFGETAAQRREELGRFVDRVVDPVG